MLLALLQTFYTLLFLTAKASSALGVNVAPQAQPILLDPKARVVKDGGSIPPLNMLITKASSSVLVC